MDAISATSTCFGTVAKSISCGKSWHLWERATRRTLSGLCYMYKLQCIESPQQLTNIVPGTSCTHCHGGSSTKPATHTCGDPSSPAPQYPTTSCTRVHQAVLPVCPHLSLWNQLPPSLFQPSMSLQRLHRFKAAAWKHLLHTDWL